MKPVRIATRASDLALAQARAVARELERALGLAAELVPLQSTGDRVAGPLAHIGGKGLFVKEIEAALLDGRADVAVHSAKDLPAQVPPELALVAWPARADARDALVARERGATLDSLPRGARVGTGSVRRAAQLLARRPDLVVVPLRGNVGTRLRKLESERLDAVVLACAGLDRLGLAERIDERLDPDAMLPAVGQGALAIETRADDPLARELAALDDPETERCVAAERAFLAGLGGDCATPLAGHAQRAPGGALRLRALLASLDGRRLLRRDASAPEAEAAALGAAAAAALRARGGDALLAELQRAKAPAAEARTEGGGPA